MDVLMLNANIKMQIYLIMHSLRAFGLIAYGQLNNFINLFCSDNHIEGNLIDILQQEVLKK